MTKEERVLARARMLMQTKGYGWSKAIDRAAESVQREDTENQERQFAAQREYLKTGAQPK